MKLVADFYDIGSEDCLYAALHYAALPTGMEYSNPTNEVNTE